MHVHQTFLGYFQDIFTSSYPNLDHDYFNVVNNMIDQHMFQYLESYLNTMEVTEAIQQLKSNYALGPNGISAIFSRNIGTSLAKMS